MTSVGDPLTARQAEVFAYLLAFIRREGHPPTYREIALHFGWKGMMNSAHGHLKALRDKGVIGYEHNKSRSIRITAGKVCECCNGLGRIVDEGGEA